MSKHTSFRFWSAILLAMTLSACEEEKPEKTVASEHWRKLATLPHEKIIVYVDPKFVTQDNIRAIGRELCPGPSYCTIVFYNDASLAPRSTEDYPLSEEASAAFVGKYIGPGTTSVDAGSVKCTIQIHPGCIGLEDVSAEELSAWGKERRKKKKLLKEQNKD